jgi:hypothetical protein
MEEFLRNSLSVQKMTLVRQATPEITGFLGYSKIRCCPHRTFRLTTHQNLVSTDAHNWSYILGTKGSTGPFDDVRQSVAGNLIFLDKLGNDVYGKICEGKSPPAFELDLCNRGHGVRNKEAAIVGQTRHNDCSKIQVLLTPSGRGIGDRSHSWLNLASTTLSWP